VQLRLLRIVFRPLDSFFHSLLNILDVYRGLYIDMSTSGTSGSISDPRGIGGASRLGGTTFEFLDVGLIYSSIYGRVSIENASFVGGVAGSALGTPLGLPTLDADGEIQLSNMPFERLVGVTNSTYTALGVSALASIPTGQRNTAVGVSALALLTGGSDNTMTGYDAGSAITVQNENTGYGSGAMSAFTGEYSDAFGAYALESAADTYNAAFGYSSLRYATGTRNTAFGSTTLSGVGCTGSDNTAVGYDCLSGAGNTGSRNTTVGVECMTGASVSANDCAFVGYRAGRLANSSYSTGIGAYALENGAGVGCTAVGTYCLQSITGSYVTAVGFKCIQTAVNADRCTTVGSTTFGAGTHDAADCIAVGYRSLYSNTTGTRNVAIGNGVSGVAFGLLESGACYNNTTGSDNTAVGPSALFWNTTGVENTVVGSLANGRFTGSDVPPVGLSYNTVIGCRAMLFFGSGDRNTSIGTSAYSSFVGNFPMHNDNTAVGTETCNQNSISAFANTVFGRDALKDIGTPTHNVIFGYQSGIGTGAERDSNTPSNNVAIGYRAYRLTGAGLATGAGNTALGNSAMGSSNTTISNCVAVGNNALNVAAVSNTTAVGSTALDSNTSGVNNTGFGTNALTAVNSGTTNTGFGQNVAITLTTGSNNSILGNTAAVTAVASANRIVIGSTASGAVDNTARIGNASLTGGVQSFGAYSNISDSRDKTDIDDCPLGLEFVEAIRTRQFRMRNGDTDTLHYGVVAQELLALVGTDKRLLQYSEGDDRYFVAYSELLAPIMRAIVELQLMVATHAG